MLSGALLARAGIGMAVLGALAVAGGTLIWRRRTATTVAMVFVVGLGSGGLATLRDHAPGTVVATGRFVATGVAVGDPTGPPGGRRLVVEPRRVAGDDSWVPWEGPRLAVLGAVDGIAAGEPVVVEGALRAAAFRTRWGWVGGVVEADTVTRLGEAGNPLLRVANRLRRRVLGGVGAEPSPERALVSGFLIGEVGALPDSDAEALRAAGLSHFVAVSGSNVGLFLAAWWVVSGPLSWSPRRRAVVGLLGLAVFVVLTRWEPSVLRAAVMAGIVLGARLVGRVVTPWEALGWSVVVLVGADGGLSTRIGFQLSLAATAGILAGVQLWRGRRPRFVWATLGATLAAQAAVAPLLLLHFGAVPLLAPLVNLIAAPLVVVATALGGIGALLEADRLVALAAACAGLVLRLARGAADLPQLGPIAAAFAGALLALAAMWRSLRPLVAAVTVAVVGIAVTPQGPPGGPLVSFLDVGQGDAILLRGPEGEVILVDGGPDAALLRSRLRAAGVRRIDLLIVSHRHADHTTGLVGLHVPVTRMWHPPQVGEGPPFDAVVAEQAARGALVDSPAVGTVAVIGAFTLEVLGPLRRYASPNDGSLVVEVTAAGISVLLSGDIEAIAQSDLGPRRADILKVPHQGAATSDLGWLVASAPALAVISVGANDYGHPSAEVIAALEAAGARVLRTDRDGTIELRLDRLTVPTAPLPSPR